MKTMTWEQAHERFLELRKCGFTPMKIRFGLGAKYEDERFVVVDLEWSRGKSPDEIEGLLND